MSIEGSNSTSYPDVAANSTDVPLGDMPGSGIRPYDPTAPAPYWHQNLELVFFCVFNGLSVIILSIRTYLKYRRLKKLLLDDYWVVLALILLICPLWTCQVGANRHGLGLHNWNINLHDSVIWWKYSWGFGMYYIVTAALKIAVCFCLLQIVSHTHDWLRWLLYSLSALIGSLGIVCMFLWLFPLQPFKANFDYFTPMTSALNLDAMRYSYCGTSIILDLILCAIPFAIISKTVLQKVERRVLLLVFVATLLGTATCAAGIAGIYINRYKEALLDSSYNSMPLIILNDCEIFMYAVGATLPTLSPYLISKVSTGSWSGSRMKSEGGTLQTDASQRNALKQLSNDELDFVTTASPPGSKEATVTKSNMV